MIYEFAATQDLHGYDKPWAPGAGKNLYPNSDITGEGAGLTITHNADDESYQVSGISEAYRGFIAKSSFTLKAGTYTLSRTASSDAVNETSLRLEIRSPDGQTLYLSSGTTATYTFEEDTEVKARIVVGIDGIDFGTGITYRFQIESGSSRSAWTSYSNICPPEGFNIWDPDNAEYVQVYAGYVNANTRELYLRPVYQEYAGEELVGPWMSSLDPYEEDTTPTEGAFVIDFGGELESFEITPFMLQTLLDSLGIRQHFTDGAGLLNSLMDQAQGRVRSEEELLNRSLPLHVIVIGKELPTNLVIKKPISDVLPGLPGKIKI